MKLVAHIYLDDPRENRGRKRPKKKTPNPTCMGVFSPARDGTWKSCDCGTVVARYIPSDNKTEKNRGVIEIIGDEGVVLEIDNNTLGISLAEHKRAKKLLDAVPVDRLEEMKREFGTTFRSFVLLEPSDVIRKIEHVNSDDVLTTN